MQCASMRPLNLARRTIQCYIQASCNASFLPFRLKKGNRDKQLSTCTYARMRLGCLSQVLLCFSMLAMGISVALVVHPVALMAYLFALYEWCDGHKSQCRFALYEWCDGHKSQCRFALYEWCDGYEGRRPSYPSHHSYKAKHRRR